MMKQFDYAVPVVHPSDATSSATASDCPTYFKLHQEGYSAVSNEDHDLLRMEGVRCHALRLAATLKPVTDARALQFVSPQNVLEDLPASAGSSASPTAIDARQASAARGESWQAYSKNAAVTTRNGALIVDEGEVTSELTELAAGDLDGDHEPEFIVRVVGFGREGNWRDIHLEVLKRRVRQSRYDVLETIAP